jgi:hypothetical protein
VRENLALLVGVFKDATITTSGAGDVKAEQK